MFYQKLLVEMIALQLNIRDSSTTTCIVTASVAGLKKMVWVFRGLQKMCNQFLQGMKDYVMGCVKMLQFLAVGSV